jgi:hypothetical protein
MPTLFETGSLFSASTTSEGQGRLIRALCAYEGSFTSMNGKKRAFTPAMLKKIAAASNAHLTSGVQVPVFYTNHEYNPKDKAGLIEGPYEAKIITEADLPDPNLTDLIGKFGVFTQVRLIREEAIADYDAKLIKPISMSVDFEGSHFTKSAIYEISLVGFSAIPGAQLFSKGQVDMTVDFKALAEQALDLQQAQEQYGATLSQQVAQDELIPKLYRLFESFTQVIRELMEDDDNENSAAQIQQAIADLSVGIASRLSLTGGMQYSLSDDAEEEAPETDPETETPPETEEEDMTQIEDLQSQIAELKQTQELQAAYSALHVRAGALVDSGYLTPALYSAEFSAASFSAADIMAKFGSELPTALAIIQEKTIELNALEKFGKPVRFGSRVHEPLDQDKDAAEVDDFMSSYSVKSPLGQY